MFDLRLEETSLPASKRERDNLISWLIDNLCLHRRRGDDMADGGTFSPIHRILAENLLSNPNRGFETRELAGELDLTPAAIHHHFTRLISAGLVTATSGKGWRSYHLTGGSLSAAIEAMGTRAKLIHTQRLRILESAWNRGEDVSLEIELPPDERLPCNIRIKEWGPIKEGENELSRFMCDMGLLGERPGKENSPTSISVRLFELLLSTDSPLSLDEAAKKLGAPKPRVGRILERFRSTGLVERIPRTDRLSSALWSAMTSQHGRRGEDWMLKKGGFERLDVPIALLKALKKGKLTPEMVTKVLKKMPARDQMLLLNLLGGRLPLGHRMAGKAVETVKKNSMADLERILRRIERVGKLLEQSQ